MEKYIAENGIDTSVVKADTRTEGRSTRKQEERNEIHHEKL